MELTNLNLNKERSRDLRESERSQKEMDGKRLD